MKQIIIDTDGNIEAMDALKTALNTENICVEAVTTVASGLTVEEAASNVLVTMESEGFSNVEVYKGLTRPMVGTRCTRKLNKHKLIGTRLEKTPNKKSAVDVMIELAEKGNVEIITMGPLTNVALAFAKNRKAMLNVKKITMLAGMVFHGDVGPLSEYNFYMDPYSADFIFKTRVPITILPIEVGTYSERMKYALNPELITKKYDSYTRIDVDGEYTYGANINDVRDRSRQEFVAQSNVMYPFNCTLVVDNSKEEITMEA